MLNAMRNGTHSKIISFVLFGLLMLATAGMVFMDAGGFFRSGVGNGAIAKVGREEVSTQAFDNTVQRVIRQQGMNAKQAYQYGVIDQILQQDINNRLLSQGAMKNGIFVGDKEVARQINDILEPMMKSNAGVSRSAVLQNLLRNQNMGEAELIGTIRNSMMSTILQASVQTGTTTIARQEALDLYRVKNETRTVEGFILKDNTVKGATDANDDVLKSLYEAAKGAKYTIPETRKFTMAILDEDNVKSSIKVSDEDLKAEYQKTLATLQAPEHRIVQQAVFDKEDIATKAVEAVKAGKSLKEAAQTASGKESSYLGEQNMMKAGLAKPIADAAFNAKIDEAVGPVKTALGYHIMVVKKIIAPEVKSFESVKEDLRKDLIQVKLSSQMQTTANTIDDRLAGGEDINKIAKEMDMKVESFGPVNQGGATPDKHDGFKDYAKDRAYILKSAFEMNEGETAPVMQLSDGRYAAIHMDKVTPLSYRPYDEVKTEIRDGWTADQQASLNHERATRIQQEIAGGTKTLVAAATENGVAVVPFSDIKRTTTPPANLGNDAITAIFDAGKGETISSPVPGGILIGTVKTVNVPEPDKVSDADLKPIMDSMKKEAGNEAMLAYIRYLQGEMKVKINRNLLDMMYGPESGSGNPG